MLVCRHLAETASGIPRRISAFPCLVPFFIPSISPHRSFFSYFICHLQGFRIYSPVIQNITDLQIPLADTFIRKHLQGRIKARDEYSGTKCSDTLEQSVFYRETKCSARWNKVFRTFGTVHQKGIAWTMHGHKFRRQHSSESMQEPKDTYS